MKKIETPDYTIAKHPVYYVYISDREMFSEIAGLMDSVADGEGQLLFSREEMTAQIFQAIEDYKRGKAKTKKAIAMLVEIDRKLGKFGGDVWFYRQ